MQTFENTGCIASSRPNFFFLYQRWILTAVAVILASGIITQPATAVDIQMTFKSGSSEFPSYDPDGSRLTTLMGHVESYYEDIFENSGTLKVEFYYHTFSDSTLALHTNLDTSGGHPTKCRIQIDTNRTWFIDETPFDNSEFNMVQTLARDISDVGSRYDGSVPDLLEYSYKGDDNGSGPTESITGFDLWSVMLHEMGHGLGMTSACAWWETYWDEDYDFNSNLVWGNSMAAECFYDSNKKEWDYYHLAAATAMYPSTPLGRRKLPSATDLFAIACAGEWGGSIDLHRKDFYSPGVNANLNSDSLWSGNWRPDSTEDAWVRHGGSARPHDADFTVNNLYVGGGSIVRTSTYRVRADHDCIVGNGSSDTGTIHAQAGGEFQVDGLLQVYEGSQILMDATSLLDVDDLHINGGANLTGAGTIDIEDRMFVHGDLITSGGTLTINSAVNVDLDGSNGGKLYVTGGDFVCNAGLTDSISTYVKIGSGYSATFANGWSLSSSATIDLDGSTANTEIHGGLFRVYGEVNLVKDSKFYCDATFESSSTINMPNSADDIYIYEDLYIEAGATFTGAGRLYALDGASVEMQDGADIDTRYRVHGDFTIEEGDIGTAVADYAIAFASTSNVIMEASADGVCDLLDTNNATTYLRGDLTLDFIDGYTPEHGDSFTVITYDIRNGTFADITWDGDFDLIANYGATALTLMVDYGYLPGDANGDGKVDSSDATILAGNWQANGPAASWSTGDFNGDGIINSSDATILAGNWQATANYATVPEPSTWCGLLALLPAGLAVRLKVGCVWTHLRRKRFF